MRTLYLLRHALPLLPGGGRRCYGSRSDPHLSPEGLESATLLAALPRFDRLTAIGCSPLLRCRETAEILSRGAVPVTVLPDMGELDCGEWDGLNFDEIRARYPEIYAIRGIDPSYPPPGGETYDHGAQRGLTALLRFLGETEGDIAVVAHGGLNRAVLCRLTDTPYRENRSFSQNYLCVNTLRFDGLRLRVETVGEELVCVKGQ